MKYLNKILITLVGLLLLFVVDASAEVGGDLNLQNKASLSSRTGYNLNLSTQGSSDSINFIVAGSSKGTVGSAGFSGLTLASSTLTSPTISGNLTFSTATAKIIPGATSLTFRNNADSADNLSIVDAGTVTFRGNLQLATATGIVGATTSTVYVAGGTAATAAAGSFIQAIGATASVNPGDLILSGSSVAGGEVNITAPGTGGIFIQATAATGDITFRTGSGANRWVINNAGTLTQDATNGAKLLFTRFDTATNRGISFETGSYVAGIWPSAFGYSAGYKTLEIGSTLAGAGSTATSLCFNCSLSANAGGSFSGDGSEFYWRNGAVFKTPNAGNTDYETYFTMSSGKYIYPSTVTAGGTTGAQTINKISGTVNFAAAATAITVTNNRVSTSSICFAVARTNDSTGYVKNVVPGSGSFVINLVAAATAETSVGFVCYN